MSAPAGSAKGTQKKAAKPPSGPAAKRTQEKPQKTSKAQKEKAVGKDDGEHTITVTIPLDRAASAAEQAVMMPIRTAQRVLPAKGGLPIYLGMGALGVAGILEWPVAVGIGIGYAVLRRGGALNPAPDRGANSSGSKSGK